MTCERVGLKPALSAYYDVSDAFAANAVAGIIPKVKPKMSRKLKNFFFVFIDL